MDFTDLYPTSALQAPLFSPGSTFLATSHRNRIIIRHSLSLQVLQSFTLPPLSPPPSPAASISRRSSPSSSNAAAGSSSAAEKQQEITSLAFSPDSERILAVCARQNVAYVFQLGSLVDSDGVEAVLHGGVERLSRVEWAPSSLPGESKTTLLVWSELDLRLTIYSLLNPEHRLVILNLKAATSSAPGRSSRLHLWSVDNRYLYIVERHNSKDTVAVYDSLSNFGLLARVPAAFPVAGLSLSPSPIQPYFSIFAHPLEYALSVHLPPLEQPLAVLPPAAMEGETLEWSSLGLGVRCAEWRPGGGWLAVGGWDGKIRLLDDREWATILTLDPLRTTPPNANVWQEPPGWIASTLNRGIIPFHTLQSPQNLTYARPDPKHTPPVVGVSIMQWNLDGTLLLVQHANAPHVLLIYAFPLEANSAEGVTVLLMSQSVRDVVWHPLQPRRLSWVCGTGGVFCWNGDWVTENEDGVEEVGGLAECIGIPNQPFNATGIRYSPNGQSILLTDDGSAEGTPLRGDGKFLLVFEAHENDGGDGGEEGLEVLPESECYLERESYVEGDSLVGLDEGAETFADGGGRHAAGLSAVWEEPDISGMSAT